MLHAVVVSMLTLQTPPSVHPYPFDEIKTLFLPHFGFFSLQFSSVRFSSHFPLPPSPPLSIYKLFWVMTHTPMNARKPCVYFFFWVMTTIKHVLVFGCVSLPHEVSFQPWCSKSSLHLIVCEESSTPLVLPRLLCMQVCWVFLACFHDCMHFASTNAPMRKQWLWTTDWSSYIISIKLISPNMFSFILFNVCKVKICCKMLQHDMHHYWQYVLISDLFEVRSLFFIQAILN